MEKLSIKALIISIGATWSLFVLLIGLSAAYFDWGTKVVEIISSIYIGYAPTFLGSLIGALWGFFDGAVAGLVFGLIYNYFVGN